MSVANKYEILKSLNVSKKHLERNLFLKKKDKKDTKKEIFKVKIVFKVDNKSFSLLCN